MLHEPAQFAFDHGVLVRIREPVVEEGKKRILELDGVFDEPGRGRKEGEEGGAAGEADRPGHDQHVDDGGDRDRASRDLAGQGEAGEESRREQDGIGALGAPDFEQAESAEDDRRGRDVDVRDGAVFSGEGRHEEEKRAEDSGAGRGIPFGPGPHAERKREQKEKVDQGGGGVAAESESDEEEHLDAFGQSGVHVRGDVVEAAVVVITADEAEVIAGAVGAGFRGHGDDQVEKAEDQIRDPEEEFPREGQRCIGGRGWLFPTEAVRGQEGEGACGHQHGGIDQMGGGEAENQGAEERGARKEFEEGELAAAEREAEGTEKQLSAGAAGGVDEESGEEDAQSGHRPGSCAVRGRVKPTLCRRMQSGGPSGWGRQGAMARVTRVSAGSGSSAGATGKRRSQVRH